MASAWIFNPPATYWDGASAFIRHAADVEGGFDKLKGKTIGLVYLDAPYGKEGAAETLRNNEDVKEFYLGIAEGRRKSFRAGKHYKRRKRWLA